MPRRETQTGGRGATDAVIPGKFALSVGLPPRVPPPGFAWRKLTDLARLESGHTPSRARPEYWNGGIPWIGIKDATSNHGLTINETFQEVSQLGVDNSSARLLPAGTVCLSRTASVGYVVIMGVPMTTSQDFVDWVCGPELSPAYLRYILMAEQESVRKFSYGTTHQTLYYPDAKAMHVCVPSRMKQDSVVQVLGALDDKIGANWRKVDLIRQVLDAHYCEAAAAKARPVKLNDVVNFFNRKRVPLSAREREQRLGVVPYYGASGIFGYVDELLFDEPLVLVGEDGSVITEDGRPVVQYIWGPSWVNNHAHVLAGKGISTELLSVVLNRADVRHLVTGAVQPKISMGKLKTLDLVIPEGAALQELETICASHMAVLRASVEESRTLTALRDTLLAQLMSGRLRVKDAEKQVEDVL